DGRMAGEAGFICSGGAMRLHDFLAYWARERPGAEFAFGGGRSLTFAEAAAAANRLANRLAGAGCGKGTRVAVLARNAPWYPLLYFAAAKAGIGLPPLDCPPGAAEGPPHPPRA